MVEVQVVPRCIYGGIAGHPPGAVSECDKVNTSLLALADLLLSQQEVLDDV